MAYVLYDKNGKEVTKTHLIDVREAIKTGRYFLTNPKEEKKEGAPDETKVEEEDLKDVVKQTIPPDEPEEKTKQRKHDKPIIPGEVVTAARRLTPAK
jgi:hypothetical protein